MTSLFDRDPTPEDLEAERELPRLGVWAGERKPGCDFRLLTQEQTDSLIRRELWFTADPSERPEIERACGPRLEHIYLALNWAPRFEIFAQRGGIDSDPLVRVLARRAWGDRDRQWFALRGVRKGEAVDEEHAFGRQWDGAPIIGRMRRGDIPLGRARHDARPGETVQVERSGVTGPWGGPVVQEYRVSDRLRKLPPNDLVARLARRKLARINDEQAGAGVMMQRQLDDALERAALDALARGIPANTMWTEILVDSPDLRYERCLMTGPDGVDTPRPLRQVIARISVEHDGTAATVRSAFGDAALFEPE